MTSKPLTKEKARKFLRQLALNEILAVTDFSKFHGHVRSVFSHYGLLMKAKAEVFLLGTEWSNPNQRERLVKRVEQFLEKNIK